MNSIARRKLMRNLQDGQQTELQPEPKLAMKNLLLIELNNASIDELKRGNLLSAFSLLWAASQSMDESNRNQHLVHTDADVNAYHFSWEYITTTHLISPEASRAYEGCVDFLSLRFLRVFTSRDHVSEIDSMCSCGFGWVIWYNLGILCAVLGTILGEMAGQGLLKCSFQLLENVRQRAELEPPSEHWTTLQLSVLANQACIYREFHMDAETNLRLGSMACRLMMASSMLDLRDWMDFYLTIQLLSDKTLAPAA